MSKLFWCVALLVPTLALADPPRVAIILDDLGYSQPRGDDAVALPAPVTCAVIPQSPHAPALAREAIKAGKEVMLHLPMSAQGHEHLDKGALKDGMNPADVRRVVREALQRIPQAVGANNHMGSDLTTRGRVMRPLMAELARDHRYFIDSRTTARTVAEQTAQEQSIPTASRDIFLDNERDIDAINQQFNKLIELARRNGEAIAIGHPYPETLSYLKRALPLMKDAGIEVVPVSRLLYGERHKDRKLASHP